ncbi:hypothetical protein [Streptomyces cinerochromogenes]
MSTEATGPEAGTQPLPAGRVQSGHRLVREQQPLELLRGRG